jgi:hypothetical protein
MMVNLYCPRRPFDSDQFSAQKAAKLGVEVKEGSEKDGESTLHMDIINADINIRPDEMFLGHTPDVSHPG